MRPPILVGYQRRALIALARHVHASGTMLRQRVLVDVPLEAETLVDARHLAGIDQAIPEMGVAVGDVAPAEWSAGGSGCRDVAPAEWSAGGS